MQPVPNLMPNLPGASIETILAIVITIVFIWWAIFTLVAMYHWFRFARDSWLAVPSIALHLFVSGWIFIFATGGLH
ncbi:MAG TPA: hypothetical protein VEB18_04430 [Candidatus Paceibacterota bacterium]|nr:hypothetical protein [Candidatus Paceibacterota bacterium]